MLDVHHLQELPDYAIELQVIPEYHVERLIVLQKNW